MGDGVIRLATRASALARRQTSLVASALLESQPGLRLEVVPITTGGDRSRTGRGIAADICCLAKRYSNASANADARRRTYGCHRVLLADLDDRERKVLKLRFGLDGRRSRTLEEVGKELHLSRERSRQIQQRALVKLRQRIARTRMQDEI